MRGRVLPHLRPLHDLAVLTALSLQELEQRHLRVGGERLEPDVGLEELLEDAVEEAADVELEEVVADIQCSDDSLDYVREDL